ncbi:hypothetical protein LJR230_002160 [Trinickia sp. LjRoot230]|uniref:hypothetical protein n=1 Tax=Trinickia sp. LjRoot230 TaxID=3342288 RepID=UPI003ECEAE02
MTKRIVPIFFGRSLCLSDKQDHSRNIGDTVRIDPAGNGSTPDPKRPDEDESLKQPLQEDVLRSSFPYDLPERKQPRTAKQPAADPGQVVSSAGAPDISCAPPSNIISPVLFASHPYRALAQANGPTTGAFLVPRLQNYEPKPEFIRQMAAAGERTAGALSDLIARESATPATVQEALRKLGDERRAIAFALTPHEDGVSDYGRIVRPDEWTEDLVTNKPTDRHFVHFARAIQWARTNMDHQRTTGKTPKQYIDVVIGSAQHVVPLAFPIEFYGRTVRIIHPNGREALPLVNRAYELFSQVLTNPALSEEDAMLRLGEAHYLLMHAQPFRRGTPSIVETFIDATLHARFQAELPPKREQIEPFWEAIFTPGSMLRDYATNFRYFFD